MNENLIDLHTHSIFSDGDLSPNHLIEKAYQRGIRTLAITDHDTLNGNLAIDFDILPNDMKVITGIELSAKVDTGRMHILGYDLDIYNPILRKKLEELQNNSFYSTLAIINQLQKDYHITFSVEQLRKLFMENKNLGRPDIAKLCLQNGIVHSIDEAFDKYLVEAYEKTRGTSKGISYSECIQLITEAKGIAILAHPHTLQLNHIELEKLILKMLKLGLKGIELYHSDATVEDMKWYFSLIQKYHLLYSGGTDYHGISVKPNIELGTGKNNNILIKKLNIIDFINKRQK